MTQIILQIIIGFLVGTLSGLFGIGGGFILVPLQIMTGVSIHQAISNSLFYITIVSFFGTIQHYKNNNVNFKVGFFSIITAIIFTQVGIIILQRISPQKIQGIFSLFILFVILNFIYKNFFRKKTDNLTENNVNDKLSYLFASFAGVLSGFASGLLGIGGGIILVPVFNSFAKLSIKVSIGTSLFVIIFTGLSGTINHLINGRLELLLLIPMVFGGIIGARTGVKIMNIAPEKNLKIGFCVLLGIIFIYMSLKNFLN